MEAERIYTVKTSVLSTLICPNTHTENVLVCVLEQINMLLDLSLQCMVYAIILVS